jgi:hypothetical protein
MRIYIESNFYVPGVEKEESLDFDREHMSLRQFLEALSMMSPSRIEYVRPGAVLLDKDDWEVDINGIPYQDHQGALDHPLKDGDTVTIRIMAFGGG